MALHLRAGTLPKLILTLLALMALAACSTISAPPPTPEAAAGSTAMPTQAPRPTAMLQPTAAPPTAVPPTAAQPIVAPAPTSAPQPDPAALATASYVIYQRSDGSLWRSDGTQPAKLTDPTEPEALLPWAAAPDGKTVAVVTGSGVWYKFHENPRLALWLVGADGSNPRKIQDLLPPNGFDPTPGGDDAFNLIPALTTYQELAWSPDGQLVAFVSAHEDQVDLYAAAIDGAVTRLTNTPRLEQGPRWSPDGALVAYRTTSGFGTGAGWGDIGLEVTPRASGQPTFVIGDRKLAAGGAAAVIPDLFWISPNILIAGLADLLMGTAEVRALTIDTRASATVFSEPYSALAWNDATRQLAIAGTSAALLQSAPDGRKLAPGLFTWSPDAGAPTQIEREPAEALAWTQAGDALAYSVTGKQPGLRVWEIGAEGDLKKIGGKAMQLRWSIDGQRLATDTVIFSRDGKQLANLAGQNVDLIGWGAQGLFYYTLADGDNHDLWLWDGAQTRQIDSRLTKTERAGTVLVQQ